MKNNLLLLLFCVAFSGLISCGQKEKHFSLNVEIKNMPVQPVYLEELGYNENKLIDSTKSDASGKFGFKGNYAESRMYRVRMGRSLMLVVIDAENIKLTADWKDLPYYTAAGSAGSSSLVQFMREYVPASKDMLGLGMVVDSLKENNAPDSLLTKANADFEKKAQLFRAFIKQYADTTQSMPVALFVAGNVLKDPAELDYIKKFAANLPKRFPESKLSSEFQGVVQGLIAEDAKTTAGPAIGTTAPDFTLTSLDGKSVSLKNLRGKYVLLDFWASWCPPCRAENPNVVNAYNQYKDKNFTILSVSLDSDKSKWQEAVAKDKLVWQHVSDLQGWQSTVAALYGVQAIPSNFLIDPSGKIIAVNLRGDDLEKTLASKLRGSELANNQKAGN
jgi:peroxiredoxin